MTKVYKNEKARRNILQTYNRLLKQWGCAYRETDVPTPYGDTHVLCFGQEKSPALVLLHGVGDDSALMWLLNAKALAAHFCCYAIDTLGGPGKSRPGAAYAKGFDDCAWLDAVFSGLGPVSFKILNFGFQIGLLLFLKCLLASRLTLFRLSTFL